MPDSPTIPARPPELLHHCIKYPVIRYRYTALKARQVVFQPGPDENEFTENMTGTSIWYHNNMDNPISSHNLHYPGGFSLNSSIV